MSIHPVPSSQGRPARTANTRARRKHRFRRLHTLHYRIVLVGLTAATVVCVLNTWAYVNKSVLLADICFIAITITALIIFTAFFWGFFMLMNGYIPASRLKFLIPHASLGVLSPLLYTLNISVDLDGLGSSPISGLSLGCSLICLGLLLVQFWMGKSMVRPEALHLVRRPEESR